MLQVQTCVSVHCHQCGDALGDPRLEAYFPSEDAALDAAAQGWRIGPGDRLWCSACGPVLRCEAEGHEFTPWRAVLLCVEQVHELLAGTEYTAMPAGGQPLGREYRCCLRCHLHESRPSRWLTGGSTPGEGESTVAAHQGGGESR
jgi:hypothetical protein